MPISRQGGSGKGCEPQVWKASILEGEVVLSHTQWCSGLLLALCLGVTLAVLGYHAVLGTEPHLCSILLPIPLCFGPPHLEDARDRTQGTESPWADAVAGMGCGAHRMVPLKRTGSCRIMDRRERSVCRGSLAISMPSMMMRPVW